MTVSKIWHPYTSLLAPEPISIERGVGASLFTNDGKEIIDAISSWWVNVHGHCHPHITASLKNQLDKLHQVIFAGFTHEPAEKLAAKLLTILPENQDKIFFSDNGSTAIEVALKIAIQFWSNQGIKKTKIAALTNSYHGDTFGAMSASERGIFVAPFGEFLFDVVRVDLTEDGIAFFRETALKEEIAAFIFEPCLQGAGGMLMYSKEILSDILSICDQNNIVTIADEILTGFGRTGMYFATSDCAIPPEIFCLSKGLTGGTLPLGVTTCSKKIVAQFLSSDSSKTFFHGHSYTANPLACTAAVASLEIFEKEETWKAVGSLCADQKKLLEAIAKHSLVKNPRLCGTVTAFDVVTAENTSYLNSIKDSIYSFCLNRGVLIRPLGNTVYVMPPYVITHDQLEKIYSVLTECLNSIR